MVDYRKSYVTSGCYVNQAPDALGQDRGCWTRCVRKWKHGMGAGIHARLKGNPSFLALPSVLLSNVYSLDNKLDFLRLQLTTQCELRDC